MRFQPGPTAVFHGRAPVIAPSRRSWLLHVPLHVPSGGGERACGDPRCHETPDRRSGGLLPPPGPPGNPALSPVMEWVVRDEYIHYPATQGEVMDAHIFGK